MWFDDVTLDIVVLTCRDLQLKALRVLTRRIIDNQMSEADGHRRVLKHLNRFLIYDLQAVWCDDLHFQVIRRTCRFPIVDGNLYEKQPAEASVWRNRSSIDRVVHTIKDLQGEIV